MQLLGPGLVAFIAAIALSVTTAPIPAAGSPPPRSSAAGVRLPAQHPSPSSVHGLGTRSLTAPGQAAPPEPAVDPSRGDLPFTWPLSPRPAVHRRFEQPRNQWSRGHRGVDLLAVVGQPVLTAGDGVVAFSGVVAGRGVVTVRHSSGLRTSYEPVDSRLTPGVFVHRGARIGVISATAGHCAPLACLHWGAITGATYQDPLSLLGFTRPILLPLG